MLKSVYQVAVLYPPTHPEQDVKQRYRLPTLRNKTKENMWEFESKPYH